MATFRESPTGPSIRWILVGGVVVVALIVAIVLLMADGSDSSDTAAATAGTTVKGEADLAITNTHGESSVAAGGTLTYTITVSNAGPLDATGVTVSDSLPADATLIESSGCTEDPAGAPTCSLGTIAAGGTTAFTLTVSVGDLALAGILTNTANATSDAADPNVSDNEASESTSLLAGNPELGHFNPSDARWTLQLRDATLITFTFGNPKDKGVMGDWNGDGHRTPGVYRPSRLTFYGRNSNSDGVADFSFRVGELGDTPVSGDWNGDGKDSLALYRPSTQQFFVFDDFADLGVDHTLTFGDPGDIPFSGDFDGDGLDDIAIGRPSGAPAGQMFFLTTAGVGDVTFTYGDGGDRPFFGDWDHNGVPTIGVYRPGDATFYLRNSNTAGVTDTTANLSGSIGNESPLAGPF